MKQLSLLFLLALLTACSGVCIGSRLDEIDNYVEGDPQAALAALTELDMGGVRLPHVKAHYSLLHSKALDKCYIDTTDTSVIMDAVNYYARHGSPDQKMQSYYYLGRIHGNAGRWSESIIALTNALQAGEVSADVKYKGRIYIAMADAYNHNYNAVEEGRCVDKALEYFNASGDSVQIRAAISCKAVSSMNLRKYDEAEFLFQSLLDISDLRPSLRSKCLVKYAYLLALTDNPDINRTYQLFQDAIAHNAIFSVKDEAAYAYILWCVGDSDGSERKFRELEQRDSTIIGVTSYWKRKIKVTQGQYKEAYDYLIGAIDYQSQEVDSALQQSIAIAQRDMFSAVSEQQKAKVKSSKTISVLIAATSISLLLLLLFLGLNIIRRNKERNLQTLLFLENIKEKLITVQKSADDRQATIDSLQLKFREVFQSHYLMLGKLYESAVNSIGKKSTNHTIYNQVQEVFKAIRGEEETDHKFEKIIDRDLDGLVSRFRTEFSNLKEVDYLMFCYIVAGYDAKTISIILSDKSPDSIYERKSRLKKMIQQSDAKYKEEYLNFF